jgi:hypothetical protein
MTPPAGHSWEGFGRKPITLVNFAIAFMMTPILFLWTQDPALLLH